jgi:hypothetical protein
MEDDPAVPLVNGCALDGYIGARAATDDAHRGRKAKGLASRRTVKRHELAHHGRAFVQYAEGDQLGVERVEAGKGLRHRQPA